MHRTCGVPPLVRLFLKYLPSQVSDVGCSKVEYIGIELFLVDVVGLQRLPLMYLNYGFGAFFFFLNNVVKDREREVVVGPGNLSMITLEVRAGLVVLLIQSF